MPVQTQRSVIGKGARRAASSGVAAATRPPAATLGTLAAPLRLAVVVLLLASGWALGQSNRLEIGVGGNVVVGAWNPLRLVANDVPAGSVLSVTVDQGSLRSGPIPALLRLPIAGGGGVTVVDQRIYLPNFSSIVWTLSNDTRVVSSGSLTGRDHDGRPLDIVVSRQPGRFATAFPSEARVVDLSAAELPLEPSAYDGVRSIIVDGTSTAPRLEAIAAAAGGGALVVLHGELPSSHAELDLLVDGQLTRLGAGAVATTSGNPTDAVSAILAFAPLERQALLDGLAAQPLVEPPAPLSQAVVLAVAAALGLLVVALMRLFAAPGVVAALLLAGLLSLVGWRALRPTAAELVGSNTLAIAGGALALSIELREYFTLPAAEVDVGGVARPLQARPYRLDADGMHAAVPRWRSLLVQLPASLAEFPLRLVDGGLENVGDSMISDVVVIGLGPQERLPPGARRPLLMAEEGPLPSVYRGLDADLPTGSVLASSGCPEQCTIWLAPAFVNEVALVPAADDAREAPL